VRSGLAWYLGRRLAALAATVVLAPAFAFLVMNGLRDRAAGEPGLLAELWDWMQAAYLHLDLGMSRQPGDLAVKELLLDGLPVDAELLGLGLLAGLLLGLVGGIYAGARPRSAGDRGLSAATALVLSCPPYWPGFMILVLFASGTGEIARLPFISGLGDYDDLASAPLQWLKAMWIPILVVAAPIAAQCLRMTATTVREALGEDFLRTAQAKGLSPRQVLVRHAVPVALPAVTALAGVNAITALTTVALVESAFNVPGVFREVNGMVSNTDYALIQGLVLEAALFVGLANLVADAVQAVLDPRVRR
jgi:ABC-type dipeptide/oligopeptide/nickel transport system permease component